MFVNRKRSFRLAAPGAGLVLIATLALCRPCTVAAWCESEGTNQATGPNAHVLSSAEMDLVLQVLRRDLDVLGSNAALSPPQRVAWLHDQAELLYRAVKNVAPGKPLTGPQEALIDGLTRETFQPAHVPAPADPDPSPEPRPIVITTGAVSGPLGRIRRQDVAIIHRLAESELAKLRRQSPQASGDLAERLDRFIEVQLATSADVPRHDPTLLTSPERDLARSMAHDVLDGKPAPELKPRDTRLTADVLKSLLAEARAQGQSIATVSTGDLDQGELRNRLIEFARKRARELSGITGDLTPDELSEIENVVDLSLLPEALKVPTPDLNNVPRVPAGKTPSLTAEVRARLFMLLREVCTKVFPLFAGLDANARRSNLVRFIIDNAEVLAVNRADAEALVGQFLAENPGALDPAPAVGVMPAPAPVIPYILIPQPAPGRCLPLR